MEFVKNNLAHKGLILLGSKQNEVKTMAADALAPCIITASLTKVLAMWDKWLLVFHEESFNLPVPSIDYKMLENVNGSGRECAAVFYMVLLSIDSKTRSQGSHTSVTWPKNLSMISIKINSVQKGSGWKTSKFCGLLPHGWSCLWFTVSTHDKMYF